MSEYRVLTDGCSGDAEGLAAALAAGFEVVFSSCSDEGYGHHGYDEIYRTADGRLIHAECGGCSCEGFGSWSYCTSEAEAMRLIPEWRRGGQ